MKVTDVIKQDGLWDSPQEGYLDVEGSGGGITQSEFTGP